MASREPPQGLVALTGYGQSEDVATAMRSGFDLHLATPVQSELLLQRLGELLAVPPEPQGRVTAT